MCESNVLPLTCLADLVPWLAGAGAEAVANVEDNDFGCNDDDNDDNEDDDGASGGEAADAVCLDRVWKGSSFDCCSLVVSSGAELVLPCWPPTSPSPLSNPPLPCL